jgi:hypothetical protein
MHQLDMLEPLLFQRSFSMSLKPVLWSIVGLISTIGAALKTLK